MIARFVDAFTDVGMGIIVDKSPRTNEGKFRPWIRRMAGPVAITSFLIYQTGLQDMGMGFKIVYMYITYLLYGSIFYTAINIPYGSMQAAITSNPTERTQLSQFRSMGATIAQLVIGSVTPLIIYKTVNGQEIVKTDSTFTILAGAFSLLAVLFYFFCYKLTTERVDVDAGSVDENHTEKQGFVKELFITIKGTFGALKNRSLIGIIFTALFMILGQLMISSINNYLFPNVYNSSDALSQFNMLNPIIALVIATPIAPIIANKIGKKEFGILALGLSALAFGSLFFIRPENVLVFMAIAGVGMFGFFSFNVVIWAIITDVIDNIEIETHHRQDGQVYSLYSFSRKMGQAIAGGVSGIALSVVGYQSGAVAQSENVLNGIYDLGTIVPAVAFLLAALSLLFIFPLDKNKVNENVAILEARRNNN
jgi:GPH family glycoside/pentoside/hexuronide:cation symporter